MATKNVLLIKMTSLGDVIHALPAITDASTRDPSLRFHWVVEAPFAEIAAMHPAVSEVIPVAMRQWRNNKFKRETWHDFKKFKQRVKSIHYDAIIDAQGLLKSALLSCMARGPRHGLDKTSAREAIASWFYQHRHPVNKQQHAIDRLRHLFAKALGYAWHDLPLNYGINIASPTKLSAQVPYLVFLHGTTWPTKHWPDRYWHELAKLANDHGLNVQLVWGNAIEEARAKSMATLSPRIIVQPKLNLTAIADLLKHAKGVVAVDTGLGHLAAALGVPTLSLYGPTDYHLTGTRGPADSHLAPSHLPCAPCLNRQCQHAVKDACMLALTPTMVWRRLETHITDTSTS